MSKNPGHWLQLPTPSFIQFVVNILFVAKSAIPISVMEFQPHQECGSNTAKILEHKEACRHNSWLLKISKINGTDQTGTCKALFS